MFVVKNDDGKNDHKRYKSICFNYFLTCYYRVRLFLAMQVRVMAACMESQADILECTASAQSGRREVTVCFSPMSMVLPIKAESRSTTVTRSDHNSWRSDMLCSASGVDFYHMYSLMGAPLITAMMICLIMPDTIKERVEKVAAHSN